MRSEYWSSTAIVIVWDDFGRFYDPVPPPHYDVMGLGPRTPALIISPWTKRGDNPDGGSIDSTVYEFSSVLRFIEDLQPEADDQPGPAGGSAVGRVRLHAGAASGSVDPPPAGLPELLMRAGRAAWPAAPGDRPLARGRLGPQGDVAGCRGGDAAGAPDLVDARGEIVDDTSACGG